jgi:alpha-glucoside transport system substrate-binding protein
VNHGDDAAVDELIEAYLACLRGEGPPPDLAGLNPDERARVQQVFELLDAVTDVGRELPAFEDDPVARGLGHGPPSQGVRAPAPVMRLLQPEPVRTPPRRPRFRFHRSLWLVAAAVTLVVAASSLVSVGDRAQAPAPVPLPVAWVERITLTGDCSNLGGTRQDVVVAATWGGLERDRFAMVLEQFARDTNRTVGFATPGKDPVRDLAGALRSMHDHGCLPDVALLPQPGLMKELADDDLLLPLDEATKAEVARNYSGAWQELGEVDDVPYGVWFKAANKSIVWYNANAFAAAGVAPPTDWEELKAAAAKLLAAGITPFAVAAESKSAWVLSDWFENVYLRTAGPEQYDDLTEGRLAWTDPTVKRTLARLAEIFGTEGWLAGGADGSLQLSYEESVRKVFANPTTPEAAMVFEGDFVASEVAATPSAVGSDARFFPFPSIGLHEPTVVGTGLSAPGEAGGDVAVLLRESSAGRDLLRYLATPQAAGPWVRQGGFVSPNQGVPVEDYRESTIGEAAKELANAPELRFDLSDLVTPAFGSTPDGGMWKVLQEFLADPTDIDGTAQRLQQAWEAAH